MNEEVKEEVKPKRGRPPKAKEAEPKYKVFGVNAKHFEEIGFDLKWLDKIADQYDIEVFQYVHKFRAFRVFVDGAHRDWVDVNDCALLNGHRKVEIIRTKYQPLNPKRQMIKYPWR